MLKIIVAAPQSIVKAYAFEEWIRNVRSIRYPIHSIYLADNSPDDSFLKLMSGMDICAGIIHAKINPEGKQRAIFLAESHEACRQYAIRENADYMLHWETDVVDVPVDIVERLLIHQVPVVSGCYPINLGHQSHLIAMQLDQSFSMSNSENLIAPYDVEFINGGLKEIAAAGLGICLIKNNVLKQITFRARQHINISPDTYFGLDLLNLGIKQYLDTGILCNHKNKRPA